MSALLEVKDPAKKRAAVLTVVRDVVSAIGSGSFTQRIKTCAGVIPDAEFSDLLQSPDIEGHAAFISKFSSNCVSDLRLACMVTNDHALFKELQLGTIDAANDEPFRRLLGCPLDEVEVRRLGDNKFIASVRIKMFQKRMRTQKVVVQ
ncbi:hypothetical protein AZE42_07216 [Rhizopogon vesiculosus]|uniref:Uncharacterized protein n=1 Tax=Rhizopogon vesiculosus TaxID=180088 RepID=A0A1J8PH67_9AGAM|nr:hypothetical protein AZE42_07216 [Rhizopogon vesiculosus]